MLINRAFGDAGRFADKLTGAHFVASFTAQPPRSFLQRRAKTDPRAVNRSRASVALPAHLSNHESGFKTEI